MNKMRWRTGWIAEGTDDHQCEIKNWEWMWRSQNLTWIMTWLHGIGLKSRFTSVCQSFMDLYIKKVEHDKAVQNFLVYPISVSWFFIIWMPFGFIEMFFLGAEEDSQVESGSQQKRLLNNLLNFVANTWNRITCCLKCATVKSTFMANTCMIYGQIYHFSEMIA